MWITLIAIFLLRYAEPIKDGDVFFHMKYGEYHIENKTTLADHSMFSWTPAAKYVPYCTWAADVFLFLLHKTGGWPLLYIFKYLCLISPILMAGLFARKLRLGRFPLTFVVLLVLIFAVVDAAFIKPEILSLVFFVLVSALYFFIKIDSANEKKGSFFLLYPLIFLFWVNMHGVFMFGLLLLAAIITGEFINYLIKSKYSFSGKTIAIVTISGVVSVASTLLTPYGLDYHAHILKLVTEGVEGSVVNSVIAYKSILGNIVQVEMQHNLELWCIMAVIFVVLFVMNAVKNRDWDFGILLPTLFLALIGLKYQRSAFYWPAFWAMSILYLASKKRSDLPNEIKKIRPVIKYSIVALISCFCIYIPARAAYEGYHTPSRWNYFGFGFSYVHPVQESAFLKEKNIGEKLFNSYNTGSYIIFDQNLQRKVFIDPRYFPYKGYLFDRYIEFRDGHVSLEEMESEFGFDIAIIEHSSALLKRFFASEKWKPVFYADVGVVFIRDDLRFQSSIYDLDKHRFDALKNVVQAADIVVSAQNISDYEVASYVITIMKEKLNHLTGYEFFYHYCASAQKGLLAYEKGDYKEAFKNLWGIAGRNYTNLKVIKAVKNLVNIKLEAYVKNEEYVKALNLMMRTLEHFPNDADMLYNAGTINYMALRQDDNKGGNISMNAWRNLFRKMLRIAPDHPNADIVKKLLKNEESLEALALILNSVDIKN